MEPSLIEDHVRQILAGTLEVDPGQIDPSFGPARADGWDSFANLRIISALEREFALKLGWEEIQQMTDFSRIVTALSRRVP